jgi:hypothetical protein
VRQASSEILERLREKLDRAFKAYENRWRGMEKSEIIANAKEISGIMTAYEELKSGGFPGKQLEYLLRFENPLMAVWDQWRAELEFADVHEELSDVLWEMEDKRDADELYELDSAFQPDGIDEDLDESMDKDMKMKTR